MIVEDQRAIVAALSDGAFYGQPGARVERIDTHSAVIFLVGERAYKLKRAVWFDYLDFSTAALRHAACEAEVRLNRRTAPSLYLGVCAVTRERSGQFALNGDGPAADSLVEMARFDNDQLLDRLAERGALSIEMVEQLARIAAGFHGGAEPRFDLGGHAAMQRVIEGNAEAFVSECATVLDTKSVALVNALTRHTLDRQGLLLNERRCRGFVRQCHGDLHLGNIVLLGDEPTLFDGIEFNDDLACIDVWYDLAFLLMDLWHRGLRTHANAVFNEYLVTTNDAAGLLPLPLFLSCRAAIRAKTSVSAAAVQPDPTRAAALHAAGNEYLALAEALLQPATPRLVALGGLSGAGKSAVARALAPELDAPPGAVWLRSDRVRKLLGGAAPLDRLGPAAYSPDMSQRVYAELLKRAAVALAAGRAVVVDAVHADEETRDRLAHAAQALGVPFQGMWLDAPAPVRIKRLGTRMGDVSDATPAVGQRQEAMDPGAIAWTRVDATGDLDVVVSRVRRLLTVSRRADCTAVA